MYKNNLAETPWSETKMLHIYIYTAIQNLDSNYLSAPKQFVRMKSCDLLVVFQLALDLHNLLRQSASPPVVLPADHEFSKFHKPCEKIDAPPGWFDKIQRNIITLRSFYGKCYGIIIGRNLKSWKRFFGAWTQSSSRI